MTEFKYYGRKGLAELRPITSLEVTQGAGRLASKSNISISQADLDAGSPFPLDMIARNPKNHNDQWLVAAQYFVDNFQEVIQDFGWAINKMKEGDKVARKGWNGKGMFLFLVPGSTFKVNRAPLLGIYEEGTEITYQPHIDMKTADDRVVPWLASQSDMLDTDWEIVV